MRQRGPPASALSARPTWVHGPEAVPRVPERRQAGWCERRIGWELGVVSAAAVGSRSSSAPVVSAPSTRLFGTEIVGRNHDPFTVIAQFQRRRPSAALLAARRRPARRRPRPSRRPVRRPSTWLVWSLTFLPVLGGDLCVPSGPLRHGPADRLGGSAAFASALLAVPLGRTTGLSRSTSPRRQWLPLYLLALWLYLDRPTLARMLLQPRVGSPRAGACPTFWPAVEGHAPERFLGSWSGRPPVRSARPPRPGPDPADADGGGRGGDSCYASPVVARRLYHLVPPRLPFALGSLPLRREVVSYLSAVPSRPDGGRWARELMGANARRRRFASPEQQVAVGWFLLLLGASASGGSAAVIGSASPPERAGARRSRAERRSSALCRRGAGSTASPSSTVRVSLRVHPDVPDRCARFGAVVKLHGSRSWPRRRRMSRRRRAVGATTVLALLLALRRLQGARRAPSRWRGSFPSTPGRRLDERASRPVRLLDFVPVTRLPAIGQVSPRPPGYRSWRGIGRLCRPEPSTEAGRIRLTHVLVRARAGGEVRPAEAGARCRLAPHQDFSATSWVLRHGGRKAAELHGRRRLPAEAASDGTSWRWMPRREPGGLSTPTPAPVRALAERSS